MSEIDWFAQYIRIDAEHPLCWTFASDDQRPNFYVNGTLRRAYRWSYEYFHQLTLWLHQEIDHTCRNPRCVYPGHLSLKANRAEHAAIEKQRNDLIKEHSERTGETVAWGADPDARLQGWSVFWFALEHRLPFKLENFCSKIPPRDAPIVIQERDALAADLAARKTWLQAQGETEETYSITEAIPLAA